MKKIDFFLIFRYGFLTLFVILMLYIISMVQDNVASSFDFRQLWLTQFIGFTLIGCALHSADDNIFKKDTWGFTFKPVTLIFVLIYFVIAISLVAIIGFLISLYLKLGISASLFIMPFQILFGYTSIRLFQKKN